MAFFMTTGGQTFTVFGLPASHKIRVTPKIYFLANSASFKTVEIISPTNSFYSTKNNSYH